MILTNDENHVLLLRRNCDPGKGKLGMPGGFVDIGETAEQAAIRETFEEVGLSTHNLRYIVTFPNSYVHQSVEIPVLDIFFTGQIATPGESMKLAEAEVSEADWFPLTDSVLHEIAFESNRLALLEFKRTFSA